MELTNGKKVREVMTQDVRVVDPESSVEEAAQRMKDLGVGAMPVCEGETLLGMITDRDIVIRCIAEGMPPQSTVVREIMSEPAVFCYEEQDIEDVARVMEGQKIRRLVVLNAERRLVGIVSLGDIAVKAGREYLGGEILEKVSTVRDSELHH